MEYCRISDEELRRILIIKLNDPYLSDFIITIKKKQEEKEKKDALAFHIENWENISGKYFYSQELSPFTNVRNIYSYVLDNKKLIFQRDRVMDFFKETGISFQVRELLLDVIGTKTKEFKENEEISNLHKDIVEWRNYNDSIYGALSKKITNECRNSRDTSDEPQSHYCDFIPPSLPK